MGENGRTQIWGARAGNDQCWREFRQHIGMARGRNHRVVEIRTFEIGHHRLHDR